MHAASAGAVLPVFILDPHLLQREAPQRLDFLFGGLHQLDEDLRKRGSRLPVRSGEPQEVLSSLLLESGAESIHALEDYSPYAIRRDEVAARSLPLCLHSGVTVHSPAALRKADGKPTRFLRLSVKTGKPCLSHIRLRRRLEAFFRWARRGLR